MVQAKMTAAERRAALELEFERLKERADYIDKILQGESDVWFRITEALAGRTHIGVIELDKPIAEGRQVALAMARIAQVLDPPARAKPVKQEEAPADPLSLMESKKAEDEVAARRALRQA